MGAKEEEKGDNTVDATYDKCMEDVDQVQHTLFTVDGTLLHESN